MSPMLLDRRPPEHLEDEVVAPVPDPTAIAVATSSLGSYCLRWQTSLIERRARTSSRELQLVP